jgi:hypothetical protein
MKPKEFILIVLIIPLASCASVNNLESISAYDGTPGSLFRITARGNEACIMTRDTLREPFTIKTYSFGERERSDIGGILTTYGFPSLRDHYKPMFRDVSDGETLTLEVVCNGKRKSVFCDNNIPWRAKQICMKTLDYFASKTPNKAWVDNPLPRRESEIETMLRTLYPEPDWGSR